MSVGSVASFTDPRNVCILCRAKKPVTLPEYHFIDHRIEIIKHDKDYSNVILHQKAVARYSPLPKAKQ